MLKELVAERTCDSELGSHTLSLRLKNGALKATVYVPARPCPTYPSLLALHGISRKASAISASFSPICLARGQTLIVPRFSRKHWPHFQQIGRVRADHALLELLATVETLGLARTDKVDLFGYSGGAQLAHRFAMLYPNRIDTLHLAAAGWYCLPDTSLPFPMGLGIAEEKTAEPGRASHHREIAALARCQLRTFLELPFRIYVGDEDHHRDPALRTSPLLDLEQGRTRRARARTYAQCVSMAAQNAGITPDVILREIPGCAHNFSHCAAAGMSDLVCR